MIEVFLTKDVEAVGKAGDVVRVRPGYARNFLFPHGLAREATAALRAERDARRAREEAATRARRKALEDLASRLAKLSLTLSAKAGPNKVLFGSVGRAEIAAALKGQGVSVAPEAVDLPEPIKAAGVHTVPVRLAPDLAPTLKIWIVEEGSRG